MSSPYRQKCFDVYGDKCHICGSGENVEAHHVDGDKSNDSIDNLLPLCKTHHERVHNYNGGVSELAELVEGREGGARPFEDGDMKSSSIRMPQEVLEGVDEIADELRMTRSKLIRDTLIDLITGELEAGEGGSINGERVRELEEKVDALREVVKSQQETIDNLSRIV